MRRTVRRWIAAVGVAAFAAGAGGAATGLAGAAGAPAAAAAVRAAGDCMPTDCGTNHNQVLA
jgi:hypothetical protein